MPAEERAAPNERDWVLVCWAGLPRITLIERKSGITRDQNVNHYRLAGVGYFVYGRSPQVRS